jgi:hypothetical protein
MSLKNDLVKKYLLKINDGHGQGQGDGRSRSRSR